MVVRWRDDLCPGNRKRTDDGRLWASEFGQDSFDELNLIEAGDDYGWPAVEGSGGEPEFQDPELTWSTIS